MDVFLSTLCESVCVRMDSFCPTAKSIIQSQHDRIFAAQWKEFYLWQKEIGKKNCEFLSVRFCSILRSHLASMRCVRILPACTSDWKVIEIEEQEKSTNYCINIFCSLFFCHNGQYHRLFILLFWFERILSLWRRLICRFRSTHWAWSFLFWFLFISSFLFSVRSFER